MRPVWTVRLGQQAEQDYFELLQWTRNVLKQRPDLKAEDLERTRSLMNAHVRDSLVTVFEHLIPGIELAPESRRG